MRPLVAVPIGSEGFVSFAKQLERLGVVDHGELLGLLELHGRVMRLEIPLDEDEPSFAELTEQFLEVAPTILDFFDRLAEETERTLEEKKP